MHGMVYGLWIFVLSEVLVRENIPVTKQANTYAILCYKYPPKLIWEVCIWPSG